MGTQREGQLCSAPPLPPTTKEEKKRKKCTAVEIIVYVLRRPGDGGRQYLPPPFFPRAKHAVLAKTALRSKNAASILSNEKSEIHLPQMGLGTKILRSTISCTRVKGGQVQKRKVNHPIFFLSFFFYRIFLQPAVFDTKKKMV